MAQYKLVDEKTGVEIHVGDTVTTFRGEKTKVLGFTPPRSESSTGRVSIEEGGRFPRDYYPSVIGAKIVEV